MNYNEDELILPSLEVINGKFHTIPDNTYCLDGV